MPLAVLLAGMTALSACSLSTAPKQPQAHQAAITPPDAAASGAASRAGSGGTGGVGHTVLPVPAAVRPGAASSLVAAFNGGFKMADAHGGYYTEGRTISPLARGAASLVIYGNGSATVGAWGTDVAMTPAVAAVRQNLFPLVAEGRPAARASTRT